MSQVDLARILKVQQAAVSKLERRADVKISTLRTVVGAMGAQLDVFARFPDGTVKALVFSELSNDE